MEVKILEDQYFGANELRRGLEDKVRSFLTPTSIRARGIVNGLGEGPNGFSPSIAADGTVTIQTGKCILNNTNGGELAFGEMREPHVITNAFSTLGVITVLPTVYLSIQIFDTNYEKGTVSIGSANANGEISLTGTGTSFLETLRGADDGAPTTIELFVPVPGQNSRSITQDMLVIDVESDTGARVVYRNSAATLTTTTGLRYSVVGTVPVGQSFPTTRYPYLFRDVKITIDETLPSNSNNKVVIASVTRSTNPAGTVTYSIKDLRSERNSFIPQFYSQEEANSRFRPSVYNRVDGRGLISTIPSNNILRSSSRSWRTGSLLTLAFPVSRDIAPTLVYRIYYANQNGESAIIEATIRAYTGTAIDGRDTGHVYIIRDVSWRILDKNQIPNNTNQFFMKCVVQESGIQRRGAGAGEAGAIGFQYNVNFLFLSVGTSNSRSGENIDVEQRNKNVFSGNGLDLENTGLFLPEDTDNIFQNRGAVVYSNITAKPTRSAALQTTAATYFISADTSTNYGVASNNDAPA